MEYLKKLSLLATSIFCIFIDVHASATPWYAGGGIGQGLVEDYCEGPISGKCEDEGIVIRGFAGVRVGPVVAFEVTTGGLLGMTTPNSRVPEQKGDTDVDMLGFNTLIFIPLSNQVKLFTGVGINYSKISTEIYPNYYYGPYATNKSPALSSGNMSKTESSGQISDWFDFFDGDNDRDDDDDYDNDGYSDYDDKHITTSSTDGSFILGLEAKFSNMISGRFQLQSIRSVDGGDAFGKDRDVNFFSFNVLVDF